MAATHASSVRYTLQRRAGSLSPARPCRSTFRVRNRLTHITESICFASEQVSLSIKRSETHYIWSGRRSFARPHYPFNEPAYCSFRTTFNIYVAHHGTAASLHSHGRWERRKVSAALLVTVSARTEYKTAADPDAVLKWQQQFLISFRSSRDKCSPEAEMRP